MKLASRAASSSSSETAARLAALVPDAEANSFLGQVARDAKRHPRVAISSAEELDELAPLWSCAPGAVAVDGRDDLPATRALPHARRIRPDRGRVIVTSGRGSPGVEPTRRSLSIAVSTARL
jgi:hypothetical protein